MALGSASEGLVADPASGIVAAGVTEPPALVLVHGADGRVLRRIPLPAAPRHLSLAHAGGPVLVPAEDANALLAVPLRGTQVSRTSVGRHPHDAARAAGQTFVSDEYAGEVSVLGGGRVLRTIDTGGQPGGIAAGAGRVALVDVLERKIDIFAAPGGRVLGTMDAGEGPTHAVTGQAASLFVVDTQGDAILRYSLRPEPRLLGRTPLPGTPYGIAIDPRRGHLWVTQTARNRVVELRITRNRLRPIRSYPTVRQPNSVAVDSASGMVYVVSARDGSMQRIQSSGAP